MLSPLQIGSHIVPIPIIQGGMGVGISLSGLASAVADCGCVGVIATAGIGMCEPDFFSSFVKANIRALRKEIHKVREATRGILGVNIMVATTNYADMVHTAIEEKIDVIFSGAGLPLKLPLFHTDDSNTALVPIVSSGRAASILCKHWIERYNYIPDGMVVEGPLAGGHLGFHWEQIHHPAFRLEKLISQVVAAVKPFEEKSGRAIPVIAAGGIYTGADILKFIRLGAAGVQMGTRFVVTEECDASEDFKQTYLKASAEDIIIIKSPVGMPGRVIRNEFIEAMNRGEKEPFQCPYHCIITCDYQHSPYCIALALIQAQRGNFRHGFAFAGANAWRSEKIVKVQELIDSLVREYNEAEGGC